MERPGDLSHLDGPLMLDLAADAESGMEGLTSSLSILTSAVAGWGEKLERRSKEIEDMNTGGQMSARRAQLILRKSASDTDGMASTVDRELPSFRENWITVRQALLGIVAESSNLSDDQIKELKGLHSTILDFQKQMQTSVEQSAALAAVMDSVPKLNRDLLRAARRAKSSLSTLHTEIKQMDGDLPVLAATIEKVIRDRNLDGSS